MEKRENSYRRTGRSSFILNLKIMEKKFFTTAETARILGISKVRVWQLLKKGKIKGENLRGIGDNFGGYVIPAKELIKIVGSRFITNLKAKK